jgi:hypothetical protein
VQIIDQETQENNAQVGNDSGDASGIVNDPVDTVSDPAESLLCSLSDAIQHANWKKAATLWLYARLHLPRDKQSWVLGRLGCSRHDAASWWREWLPLVQSSRWRWCLPDGEDPPVPF